MDKLIIGVATVTQQLARMHKLRKDFSPQEAEVVAETVHNGQIITQGLSSLNEKMKNDKIEPGDKFLIDFFTGHAEEYIDFCNKFQRSIQAINHD